MSIFFLFTKNSLKRTFKTLNIQEAGVKYFIFLDTMFVDNFLCWFVIALLGFFSKVSFVTLSIKSRRAWIVECLLQKPNCWFVKIWNLFRNLMVRAYIHILHIYLHFREVVGFDKNWRKNLLFFLRDLRRECVTQGVVELCLALVLLFCLTIKEYFDHTKKQNYPENYYKQYQGYYN